MRIPLIMLLGAMAGLFVCQRTQAAEPDFKVIISTDHPTVTAGSRVWIKIQMRNTSDHDVNCTTAYSSGFDRSYQYDVKDDAGNPAVKRARKHPELGEPGSIYPCTLKPGESTPASDSLITHLFDLSRPGKYTVRAWRPGPHDSKVLSNTITITVTP